MNMSHSKIVTEFCKWTLNLYMCTLRTSKFFPLPYTLFISEHSSIPNGGFQVIAL